MFCPVLKAKSSFVSTGFSPIVFLNFRFYPKQIDMKQLLFKSSRWTLHKSFLFHSFIDLCFTTDSWTLDYAYMSWTCRKLSFESLSKHIFPNFPHLVSMFLLVTFWFLSGYFMVPLVVFLMSRKIELFLSVLLSLLLSSIFIYYLLF